MLKSASGLLLLDEGLHGLQERFFLEARLKAGGFEGESFVQPGMCPQNGLLHAREQAQWALRNLLCQCQRLRAKLIPGNNSRDQAGLSRFLC